MMGGKKTCLEMQDDVPDEIKNNRRDAIGNTRGIDAKQLHLRDNTEGASGAIKFFLIQMYMSKQYHCIDLLNTLTCLSSRKARALETLFSLKMR